MKRIASCKINLLIFLCLVGSLICKGQLSIKHQLEKIPGITIEKIENHHFKEYYEIFVNQCLDHNNLNSKEFKQRIFIGFNNVNAPTVFETDGYGIDYASKSDFINEPCKLIGGNMIIAEHRYFGKSIPDSIDWNYLTIKQATADCHSIHELFKNVFTGKWLSTGISKGGQTAVAYKMYYPNDVDASIVYSAPIKNAQFDTRLEQVFSSISESNCVVKIYSFQKFMLSNKEKLLPVFEEYVKSKGIYFGEMDIETIYDYSVLEYPFSFWQGCHSCIFASDSTTKPNEFIDELVRVVPLRFYSEKSRQRNEAAFYMFYHELGYYEYNTAVFKGKLKNDNYSNSVFCPKNVKIVFDDSYLKELKEFIKSDNAKNIIFIYGENDPWALVQADLNGNNASKKFIIKNGCHNSKIEKLDDKQKKDISKLLGVWLLLK